MQISLPGILRVVRPTPSSPLQVTTAEWDEARGEAVGEGVSCMRVVWDHGPVDGCWDDFDTVRARVEREWTATPKKCDVISAQLKERIHNWLEAFKQRREEEAKHMAERSAAGGMESELADVGKSKGSKELEQKVS